MIWVASAVVAIILFAVIPRVMIAFVGFAILSAIGFAGYLWIDSMNVAALRKSIFVTIHTGQARCTDDYPLLLIYNNHGSATIDAVSFTLEGRKPGYSDIVRQSEFGEYRSDLILGPDGRAEQCWKYPDLKYGIAQTTTAQIPPEALEWSVRVDRVTKASTQ